MKYQPVYDIAEICFRKGIRHAVLCPGSRCAPLTLAFTRHSGMAVRTISDERSAAFIALGLAQSLGSPVVIVCTSGTAVYNLAPAVAEAFFNHVPLILLTADRPAEWIAQHDGQTIFQTGIFGKHVKEFFQLPQDYDHEDSLWSINRMINDAVNLATEPMPGPVHVNAPFREPLYPPNGEDSIYYSDVRVIGAHRPELVLSGETRAELAQAWKESHNILVVAGQHPHVPALRETVSAFQQRHPVPVVHDIISNLHGTESTIRHSDLFLGAASGNLRQTLGPDLLITFGNSLVSKNLKNLLRKHPPRRHWHVQEAGPVADTFRCLTGVVRARPETFLKFLTTLDAGESFERQKQENYFRVWEVEERRATRALEEYFNETGLSELSLVRALLENLPSDSNLHLANSMSVRYANFLGLPPTKSDVKVFANRGTSGIDGSVSTAVGHTLASGRPNFLITGDLGFFYDRNAYWHNYNMENLRILLLNNHGGLIFDVLDGPSSTPEAQEYFITRQVLAADRLCAEFGFDHLKLDHPRKTKNLMKDFMTFDNRAKVLELEGDTKRSKDAFEKLKAKIKKSYDL